MQLVIKYILTQSVDAFASNVQMVHYRVNRTRQYRMDETFRSI